jgi:hypothetical protein
MIFFIILIEVIAGLIAFESNFAIARWEKLEKHQPTQ